MLVRGAADTRTPPTARQNRALRRQEKEESRPFVSWSPCPPDHRPPPVGGLRLGRVAAPRPVPPPAPPLAPATRCWYSSRLLKTITIPTLSIGTHRSTPSRQSLPLSPAATCLPTRKMPA